MYSKKTKKSNMQEESQRNEGARRGGGGRGNHRAQKDWGRREKQQDPAQETDEWREAE